MFRQARSVHRDRGRGARALLRLLGGGGTGGTVTGILAIILHLISIPLMEIRQLKQIFLERDLTK